ncbi:MAG TPA: IS110 family transposase [Chromatiales bacterium]|nr:IS110 family transposase [Chromatiales bacterium]
MTVTAGLDISAKTLDLVVRHHGVACRPETFRQTSAGHQALIRRLKALKPAIVVMEATGVYYLDAAVALYHAGIAISVINPGSFRHFAQLKLQNSKTDAIDAALLAEYAECIPTRRWVAPDPARLALRDLARQINRLTHARTQAKNRLHALRAQRGRLPLLIEDELHGIEQLDQRIERLRQAALTLIEDSDELSAQLQLMQTARGIGTTSAIAILGELCVLPRDMKARQVSCHAGLDVRQHQSGTSVNRPGRLSKAGNTYLRAALYMPALTAVRHDPLARAFYERLIARGKKKLQALCAVMRKYLTGLWACLRDLQPFTSSRLFNDTVQTT